MKIWLQAPTFLESFGCFFGSQEAPKMQLEHGSPTSYDEIVLVVLGKLEVRME